MEERDVQYYPLTHPQRRVWVIEEIYSGTSVHNIGGPVNIGGMVNFKLMEQAIKSVIRSNEGIRVQLKK